MSFNQINILGNLTRDPQLSYLPSQTPVVEFGIASNRKWTGKDGNKCEEVCFIDCKAFGNQADNINKYFTKGKPILITGRLTFDQWDTPEGQKRSKHRITVEKFTFVGGPDGQQATQQTRQQPNEPESTIDPDSIPF